MNKQTKKFTLNELEKYFASCRLDSSTTMLVDNFWTQFSCNGKVLKVVK